MTTTHVLLLVATCTRAPSCSKPDRGSVRWAQMMGPCLTPASYYPDGPDSNKCTLNWVFSWHLPERLAQHPFSIACARVAFCGWDSTSKLPPKFPTSPVARELLA